MAIEFLAQPPAYNDQKQTLRFFASNGVFSISRSALETLEHRSLTPTEMLDAYKAHKTEIEAAARSVYELTTPPEGDPYEITDECFQDSGS